MAKYDSILDDPHHEEHPLDELVWRAEQERKRLQKPVSSTISTTSENTRAKSRQRGIPVEEHPLDPQY